MANTLSPTGIQTNQTIEASQVSQSIDAFTGAAPYDITISGSLELTGTGSLTTAGAVTFTEVVTNVSPDPNTLNVVNIDANGRLFSGTPGSGTKGAPGTQGTDGQKGQKGEDGQKGVQGIKGAQGTIGDKGAQGTDGLKGIQGIQGTDGQKGIDGLKGIQGTTGTQGVQGTDGQKGIDGLKGVQGTDGIKGVEGDAATINPGIATGLAAGSAPTVANTGTTSAAIFDFGIPAGAKGIKGDTGSGGAGGFNPEISNTVRYIAKALSSGREWQMVSTGDIYKDLVYSRVGSTVTFQSKDHGLTTGDFIVVRGGIDSYLYVDVTVITIDEFTYLSPTTGTVSGTDAAYIPAFGVSVFSGTTSTVVAPSAGNIQMSSMVVARGIDFTTNFTLNMPNTITNGSGANTSATNQNPPIIACFNLSNGGFLTSVTVAVTTSSNFSRFTLGGLAAGVNNLMRFQF